MAILTMLYKHRFYKNDGSLNDGGKVYTYVAGTSTEVDTYTDSTGTVPNTNPIILNPKGEAAIWTNGLLKVNVLESDDTQVTGFPVDNVGAGVSNNEATMRYSGTAGGTANALTISPSPSITAYAIGQTFVFKAGAAGNSGVTTIAISGLSPLTVQSNGAACAGGEITANYWYVIVLSTTAICQISKFSSSLGSFTLAQLNSALSDADVATGGGTVTGASSGTNTGDNATNTQYSGLAASKAEVAGSASQAFTAAHLEANAGLNVFGDSGLTVATSNVHSVAGTNYANMRQINASLSANNKSHEFEWASGVFTGRFMNDAFSASLNWVSVTGGYAAGITSITFGGPVSVPSLASTGALTSSSPSAGIGYAAGAGGSVTQLTSKATAVTLNKITGRVDTHNGSLAANTTVNFSLTNSTLTVESLLVINTYSQGGNSGSYVVAANCGTGVAAISIRNVTSGALADVLEISFAVVKIAVS